MSSTVNFKSQRYLGDKPNLKKELIAHLFIISLSLMFAIIGIQRYSGSHLIASDEQGNITDAKDITASLYTKGQVLDWAGTVFGAHMQYTNKTYRRGLDKVSSTYFSQAAKQQFLAFINASPFIELLDKYNSFIEFTLIEAPELIDYGRTNQQIPFYDFKIKGTWTYTSNDIRDRSKRTNIKISLFIRVERDSISRGNKYLVISQFKPVLND